MEVSNDSLKYEEMIMRQKMLKPNQRVQEFDRW